MKKPSVLNYLVPVIMIAIGLRHFARYGMDFGAILPVVMGIFALYLALFNHSLLQQVLVFITKIWFPIGQGISIIILTLTFYIIFAPVGLILRLLKKDILNRKFRSDRLSYWVIRPKQESNYTQQF